MVISTWRAEDYKWRPDETKREIIRKIGMICSVKPILTEDLCVVQKEEIFNNMLHVRKVHLTKGQAYS
jgi:hypothetical protein